MSSTDRDLTELVFPNLDRKKAFQLSKVVLGRQEDLPTAAQGIGMIAIENLDIGERCVLRNACLRVVRDENHDRFDLEINFVPAEALCTSSRDLIDILHEYAIHLSSSLEIDEYFAGIEPAVDEDTRFFTGAHRGPL